MRIYIVILMVFAASTNINAQKPHENKFWQKDLTRLIDFLSIPNNSLEEKDIVANIDWLTTQFSQIDFKIKRLETEGLDLFFAEKTTSETLPTVLFYMHFDGQPVDNSKWSQASGYLPVIKLKEKLDSNNALDINQLNFNDFFEKDIRVYARSASDDKGPIAMFLSALNHLKNNAKVPQFNIKVILDSQEEQGSPFLASAVKSYKNILKADYFVVFDGPMHDSAQPTLLFGARGITTIHMEVYGMSRSQHSGHYGNYGPNPVFRAAEILNSLKDLNGKVIVPGYYDHIDFDQNTLNTMSLVPDDPEIIRKRAGFTKPEVVGNSYQEAMQFPSLNVSGISAGWVNEQARTIVPDKAIVEMDIRTVLESDAEDLIDKLRKHISSLGYTLLEFKPSEEDLLTINKPVLFEHRNAMFPFRTSLDSKIGDWLRKAVQRNGTSEIVQIRTSGGSVPLSFFINEMNVPTVIVPLVNADNNQHSPNENLKLSNYFNGIETIKKILRTKIK